MSQRWIVGVDGSFASRSALDWAVRHSRSRDVQIVATYAYPQPVAQRLVSAITRDADDGPGPTSIALHELEAAVADLVAGEDVERQVVSGTPSKALIEHAGDGDLLIVGHHGTSGRWHHALGSVSRYCVTHSRATVVVVPTDWEPRSTRRITVGFDGSDNARAAVRWAATFADSQTRLDALIALEIAPWLPSEAAKERLADELRVEEARLRAALDEVDPNGVFEREVIVRGARPALSRAAEYTDLIVLGARGAGSLGSAVLGSVSTWMLDVTSCPLVVVPATATDRTEPS